MGNFLHEVSVDRVALLKMAEMVSNIPIVDFGAMSLERETRPNPGDESVVKVVKELHDAFSTIGFVYLKNHGISQEQVRH